MNWKKTVPFMAAALLAAYLGARMAGSGPNGLALAAPAAPRGDAGRMVMVTTGGPDRNGNRLVMVDTVNKQIMVYRMVRNGALRLVAARNYKIDLEWSLTPDVRGLGFSYTVAEKHARAMRAARAKVGQKWVLRGRETVLTCDSSNDEARNRIMLVNPEMKIILVYRLNGNSIWLEAARPYDYDQMLLYTKPNVSYKYRDVKLLVEQAEKRAVARARGL